MAFEVDRLLWLITIGNRIDIDTAHRLYYKVALSGVDVLDIRYFLCDGLRKQDFLYNGLRGMDIYTVIETHP